MDDIAIRKPRVSGILPGVTGTLLAFCIIPTTRRRLLVCLLRVFFGIQFGDLHAMGQPPGCTYHVVPSLGASSAGLEKLEAQASTNADRFMVMLGQWPAHRVVPQLNLFDNHPAQQWAALRVAAATIRYGSRPAPSTEYTEEARAFVERARRAYPENGALWLAEGALCAELGLDDIAIDLFHEAARHPRWDSQPGLYRRVFELLVADGYLPLNASMGADKATHLSWGGIDSECRWMIDEMLARYIRENDPVRFSALMGIVVELGAGEWRGVHAPNMFRSTPNYNAANAARAILGDADVVGGGPDDPCSLMDLETIAFLRYADGVVGPDVVNQVLPSRDARLAYFEKARGERFEDGPEFWRNSGLSDILGNLSLILIATFCSTCLLSMALSANRHLFPKPLLAFRVRWLRLAILVPFCIWGFHRALSHRFQHIGLRSSDAIDPPLLEASLVVGGLIGVVIVLSFLICRTRRGHVNLTLFAMSALLIVIHLCAHYRAALTENILTRTRHPMTQEAIVFDRDESNVDAPG
ncbi:MAG TPA: hypothetical protein P5081_11925 [Phycisphaerae bacterium]|mgnify:CR=1 FL=1|nr:hypothetical protein [Phycisphaerae bacterium]HRW53586.1 hypothetical protein [Phycisphaerae bacterium]